MVQGPPLPTIIGFGPLLGFCSSPDFKWPAVEPVKVKETAARRKVG